MILTHPGTLNVFPLIFRNEENWRINSFFMPKQEKTSQISINLKF